MNKKIKASAAIVAALALSLGAFAATSASAAVKTYSIAYQGPLTGGEASTGTDEQNAVKYAIKLFEAKNKNIKIDLSQYPIQDMIPKTVAALDSNAPPDIAYSDTYDFQVSAKWAYDGKLEDVSTRRKRIEC